MTTTRNNNSRNLKAKTKGSKSQSNVISSFIRKSYQLLEDQKFADVVDWNDEGNAVVIKNPVEFGQTVLPSYFKHNNLTSFVRQLNMYDFRKRRSQDYDHVYYHDLFQRGQDHLLAEIKRKSQDNSLVSMQKTLESLKKINDKKEAEQTADVYENQLLKKLNKDAMHKIDTLETKVKELTANNKSLKTELLHQNKKEDMLVAFVSEFLRKKGISFDIVPEELNSQFQQLQKGLINQTSSPSSDLLSSCQDQIKSESSVNVNDFFSFAESGSLSTEVPCWSPQSSTPRDFSMPSAKFEIENWDSINQFGKRSLQSDEDEFDNFSKAMKTEVYSCTEDFPAFIDVDVNSSNQEVEGEGPIDFMDVFSGTDAFLNNEPSLMSFN